MSYNIIDMFTSIDEKLARLNKLVEILIKTISNLRVHVEIPYPQVQALQQVGLPKVVSVVYKDVVIKDIVSIDVSDTETKEIVFDADIFVMQADGGTIYIQKESTATAYNRFKLLDGATMVIYPKKGSKIYVRSETGTVTLNIIKMEVAE